jgi:hypothetical protein
MIGSVGPFLKHTGKDFKCKYGLPSKICDSIIVIFATRKRSLYRPSEGPLQRWNIADGLTGRGGTWPNLSVNGEMIKSLSSL